MRTVQTAHSSTRPLLQRIGVLGAAGAVAVTGFEFGADAIGLGTAPVAAAEASGTQGPSYVAIDQFQGQPTQDADCGPTSAVIAMLAEGYQPQGYDQGPRAAIETARGQTGLASGPTVEAHMVSILDAQGVPANADTDFTGALDEVRDGKSAIITGYMDALPYVYDYRAAQGVNPHIVHAVVITDYDSADGTFRILDPNTGVDARATAGQLETFQGSLSPAEQHQTVVG